MTVDGNLKNAVRGICCASASHVWKDLDVRMRYSAILLRFSRKSLCCVGGKVGRSRLDDSAGTLQAVAVYNVLLLMCEHDKERRKRRFYLLLKVNLESKYLMDNKSH